MIKNVSNKLITRQRATSLTAKWKGSALSQESTLQQIGPYIGKMKSSMARTLISEFTSKGDTVNAAFCGSGTVAFERWAENRNVIANDLNPYAVLLTRAKLFPILSLEQATKDLTRAAKEVDRFASRVDLRTVPSWVRAFFHKETLRETIGWCAVLKQRRSTFLLSCLLAILHHQRPGFLSFPSSHAVPYLRLNSFPRELYPELYDYRTVPGRLERKIQRALKRVPNLDQSISRSVTQR